MNDTPLPRILGLDIENFRGFVRRHRLEVDADIVLLAGPNGYGKSSLLQAIQLLLTGYHEFDDPNQLRSHTAGEGGAEGESAHVSRLPVSIRAAASIVGNGERVELTLDWPVGAREPVFNPEGCPRVIRVAGLADGREQDRRFQRKLLARVTTFYPEQVEDLFRTVTTGITLRDIYQPAPTEAREAIKELKKQKESLAGLRASLSERVLTPDQLDSRRSAAQLDLDVVWRPIRAAIETLAKFVEAERASLTELAGLHSPTPKQLSDVLARLRAGPAEPAKAGADLLQELVGLTDREIESARRRAADIAAPAGLREEREWINDELQKIRNDYPHMDEFLSCFAVPAEAAALPDLLQVLKTLALHTDRWLENAKALPESERAKLSLVLTELRSVVPLNAHARAAALDQWLTPFVSAAKRRQQVTNRLKDVERDLERYRLSLEVEQLLAVRMTVRERERPRLFDRAYRDRYKCDVLGDRQDRIKELLAALDRTMADLDASLNAIENAIRPTSSIYDAVRDLSNTVLSRFALVEGFYPLRVTEIVRPQGGDQDDEQRRTKVTTASGLEPEQLSTGQRAQVAVSLALAQSQLLRRSQVAKLPYHILLLDDVSTAYDLSNLTREAVLWRQLAYHSDPSQRWQLFISSHHEDLTNHLLDLLIPPAGCSLRLISFAGWSPATGPEIESFSVEPSEDVSAESGRGLRNRLERAIKEELCPSS
jgi:energy-coupling factor transporter ATP-binding protein EcfA2